MGGQWCSLPCYMRFEIPCLLDEPILLEICMPLWDQSGYGPVMTAASLSMQFMVDLHLDLTLQLKVRV